MVRIDYASEPFSLTLRTDGPCSPDMLENIFREFAGGIERCAALAIERSVEAAASVTEE